MTAKHPHDPEPQAFWDSVAAAQELEDGDDGFDPVVEADNARYRLDDTFNGWANRETWATSLCLDNDQATHGYVRGIVIEAVTEAFKSDAEDRRLRAVTLTADRLQEQLDEWATDVLEAASGDGHVPNVTEDRARLILEIGSRWRVDYRALADGYVSEVLEDGGWQRALEAWVEAQDG